MTQISADEACDVSASRVLITRGRERGEHFLTVADDGEGVPKNSEGVPDFHFVGTHICDSIKRRLKLDGARAIQGEFGIGLLSFWTVGVIQDEVFESFVQSMAPVAVRLKEIIDEQKLAEEERTSRETLRAIQCAFRRAPALWPSVNPVNCMRLPETVTATRLRKT